MGLPGAGVTTLLRETFRDFVKKSYGKPGRQRWILPELGGMVLGMQDDFPDFSMHPEFQERAERPGFNPWLSTWDIRRAMKEGHASWGGYKSPLLSRIKGGMPEAMAVGALREKVTYVFAEGPHLGKRFLNAAFEEGYDVCIYWIDVSTDNIKRRGRRPYGEIFRLMMAKRGIAELMDAVVIDGNQEFDLVHADFMAAMLADIDPLEYGNLRRTNSTRRLG